MQAVYIRPVQHTDSSVWERMRKTLWPDDGGSHAEEIARYFSGARTNPVEVLIACSGSGLPLGFVELSIRPYAEGCITDRVAFVEGWFVAVEHRGQGIGAALMSAAEEWGRANRCSELASDTQLHNQESIAAHRALGFEETERLVCFKKSL